MQRERNNFNIWPTFADIMMGMVFLLLLVAMAFLVDQKDKIISQTILELKKNLRDSIYAVVDENDIDVKYADSTSQTNEMLIRLVSDSLFDETESALKGGYRDQLALLARLLKADASYHEIIVEGHTDDQLFSNSARGNWGLSADRAISVVELFVGSAKISRGFLSPRGYADTRHPDENSLCTADSSDWVRFSGFMDAGSYWGDTSAVFNHEERLLVDRGRRLMRRVDIRIKYNPDSIWYDISGQKQQ